MDKINNPAHYNKGKIEVIDFIEDQSLNFNRGNIIKYVARAGMKHQPDMDYIDSAINDLNKAKWYVEREISRLQHVKEEYGNDTSNGTTN